MADNETIYYEQDGLWGRAGHDSDIDAMAAAVEQILPRDVESVLDVGCGDGAVSERLLGSRQVFGGDRAMAALRHVKYPCVQLTGEALPFSTDSVDLVMCTDVIEHLDDEIEQRTLAEMIRVSRRYVLVAVPYNEPLEHFRVRCSNCELTFHAHHHQRSYDLERFVSIPGAAVDEWQLVGARWACSEPVLSETALLLGGPGYPFSLSVCPTCGHHAAGTPVTPDEAVYRRRFEAAQYLLAETGERRWPTPSEILVLLSVERDDRDVPLTLHAEATPPELPDGLIGATPDRRRATMESFPRDWYWVADGDRSVFVFPTRPGWVAVHGDDDAEVQVYDHVSARYIRVAKLSKGSPFAVELPVVSPDISGYRLAVDSDTPEQILLEAQPSRPVAGDALRVAFGADRVLSADLAGVETRQVEVHTLAESNALANEVEQARHRTEILLQAANAKLEDAGRRLAESNAVADETEARRSAAEKRLAEVEQARHRTEILLQAANAKLEDAGRRLAESNALADETEARRSAAEKRLAEVEAALASEIKQLKSDLDAVVPIDSLPRFLRTRYRR